MIHLSSRDCAAWAFLAAAFLLLQAEPARANLFGFFGPRHYYYDAPFATPRVPSAEDFARRRALGAKKRERLERARARKDAPRDAIKALPGPHHVVISINRQKLTLYANGVPVAHSPVSTGVPGHPTPTGVFSVIQRRRFHHSNIYSGAPMPFMQRITWSGIALHAGVVPGRPASHGCIRLPTSFAQRLWGITKIGARVIIARDELALTAFAHPRLMALRDAAAPQAQDGASEGGVKFASADPPAPASAETTGMRGSIAPQDGGESATVPSAAPPSPHEPMGRVERPVRAGAVSIFVSRKESRLYVRKGFAPVFDMPVQIDQPSRAIGTHVFTALASPDDVSELRWAVVSVPSATRAKPEPRRGGRKPRETRVTPMAELDATSSPAEALDRLAIPREAAERISPWLGPGATLIISDNGLSHETGLETDFVVLTR